MVEAGFEIWKSSAVFYPSNFYLTLSTVYIEVSFYSRTEKIFGKLILSPGKRIKCTVRYQHTSGRHVNSITQRASLKPVGLPLGNVVRTGKCVGILEPSAFTHQLT